MTNPTPEIPPKTIAAILEKHGIHNEALSLELAILVLQSEKAAIQESHRMTQEIISGASK